MSETKFSINEYLSLKLEDGKTMIYVLGEPFKHCKFLLINVPIDEISSFDELESIDEAAEKLDKSMEPREGKIYTYKIPSETEFWGHCSNLQVWYEQGYNTKLLHSNLAFPLLEILTKAGDIQAQKTFKEEIAERYNSGGENTRKFLRNMKYLDYLSIEEYLSLIENENERKIIAQLRNLHPHFEKRDLGGMVLKDNIDIRKGKVVKLCLSGLELRDVPEIVRELNSLDSIDLSYNKLESIPDWIGELKELKELIISDNFLKELPTTIGEMESLEKILACSNKLSHLPELFGELDKLKILELYQNEMTSIPEPACNLKNLEILDLHENKINKVTESIRQLNNLKKLSLAKNQIVELTDSIGKLKKLKSLNLSENNIKTLPESIGDLKELKLLAISYNHYISRLPDSLYHLLNLEKLYVDNTNLSEYQIKENRFSSKKLDVLYIKIKDKNKKNKFT